MKKLIGTAVLSLGVLAGSAFASPTPVQGPVKTVVRTPSGRTVVVHHRRHHRHHRHHHRHM